MIPHLPGEILSELFSASSPPPPSPPPTPAPPPRPPPRLTLRQRPSSACTAGPQPGTFPAQ